MAGKFSIYIKDDELKRNIELLAEYDNISLTQMISEVLKAYADTRADDVKYMRDREDDKQARKKAQAQAPAQEDTDQQQRTGNPNLLY